MSQHPDPSERLFTLPYGLLALTTALFFGSMYFLLPGMPLYVVAIGGDASAVGVVMGAFTVTAVLARPYAGRMSDRAGRKRAFLIGSSIFAVAPILYIFTRSVPILLLARAFHGVGIALFTVGAWALIADIIPVRRRGEGMGIYSLATLVGMIVVPPLAVPLLDAVGFTGLFLAAAASAAASLAVGLTVRERRHVAAPVESPGFLATARHSWLLVPSLVVGVGGVTYGAVLSFLPLFATERGIANVGLFFTAFALSTMVTRIPIGRLSDRVGRSRVILPTLLVMAASLLLLSQMDSLLQMVVAAVLYGASFGSILPTATALVIDRAPNEVRATALAVSTAWFDFGIGFGSVTLGVVADLVGFAGMYALTGLLSLAGAAGFFLWDARGRRPG